MLVMAYGMKNGLIFLYPFCTRLATPSWSTWSPPMPDPIRTPTRALLSFSWASGFPSFSIPASRSAFLAATMV